MYQPKIQDRLIRKLYAAAKRQGVPMTVCLNDILEEYLVDEEPIPHEARIIRRDVATSTEHHELRQCRTLRKEHRGGAHETTPLPPQDSRDAHRPGVAD